MTAAPRRRLPARLPALAVAAGLALLMAALGLVVWAGLHPSLPAADAPPQLAGLAYSPQQRWDDARDALAPDAASLNADLATLGRLTRRIRTYGAEGLEALPEIAQRHGLRLTLGAWLDGDPQRDAREIAAALRAARQPGSVERVIVGNETQLRRSLPAQRLSEELDRMRRLIDQPVSTAEPWHIWLAQPELAAHVDFITVHLLPYWEGVPAEQAVDVALSRLELLRERFPGKPLVIGEVGWPSGGEPRAGAVPSPAAQAVFVREFAARAQRMGLDYFLMEAIDQPWKRALEGSVGPHWGLLDAHRQPKFALRGPLDARPGWRVQALLASTIGFALCLPVLLATRRMRLRGRLCLAAGVQAVAAFGVIAMAALLARYPGVREWVLWLPLALLMGLCALIALAQLFEFAETCWPGSLRRVARPRPLPPGQAAPFVSLHLACCNEPPAMVIATIDSLMALDWPAFEVIVVDNNTRDPACWRPVRAHVERLRRERGAGAPAVRFIRLPRWPGYKAGALNVALARTDPRAAWIGVVDADYQVSARWLGELAGHFADADVAVVQSPQAHRDWAAQPLHRMMNWEYEGFFRIGMHHRHERNAIIQHGTMTLVRATALRGAGGWSGECVCEDSELGLRLLAHGARLVYVDEVYGAGLVPQDFDACRRQRRRWAQGAMQIMRQHRGALFGRSPLTLGQRYHFVAGWLPWIGDALNLAFTLAAMLGAVAVLAVPQWAGPPMLLFAVPLAVLLVVRLLLVPVLYARRVGCRPIDVAGAALVGLGLSHAIARGVIAGLFSRAGGVFEVTRKAGSGAPPSSGSGVREEAALLGGLVACLLGLAIDMLTSHRQHGGWLLLLGLQCLPGVAALVCAWLGTRGGHDPASRAARVAPERPMPPLVRAGARARFSRRALPVAGPDDCAVPPAGRVRE